MRVSAQVCSQRSRYACASSRLSKRIPLSGVLLAWPMPDSTFPLRSGSWDRGIVDIRSRHTFFQVVENDDSRTTTEAAKGFLMQFGPGAHTRSPGQQANRFAAVAECQNEQPRPAILAALRIAHHRTAAVVDLPFFSWSRDDDARWFRPLRSAQPANIALHRLIASGKAVVR